jgi:hypothetical protein
VQRENSQKIELGFRRGGNTEEGTPSDGIAAKRNPSNI